MPSEAAGASDISVVLIDDSEMDNFVHKEVIRRSGLATVTRVFELAEPALEWLRDAPRNVDIILLDINMPGMNGFEFLEAYDHLERRFKARRLFAMLTSSPRPDDQKTAAGFGASFETKPLTRDSLEQMIADLPAKPY